MCCAWTFYLPYALGFCFSANCFMLCVSLSAAVFNWHIASDTLSIGFFFQCSVCDLMDVN